MDQPLKVLCELGGWKTAKTVLQCYQQVTERSESETFRRYVRVVICTALRQASGLGGGTCPVPTCPLAPPTPI